MRILKFRQWDKVNKRFISHNKIDVLIKNINNKNTNFLFEQYTSLKDMNGNEIYEGDILRFPAKDIYEETTYDSYEVYFHDGNQAGYNIGFLAARMCSHGNSRGGCIPYFLPKTTSKMIIIGNIHENPELLER